MKVKITLEIEFKNIEGATFDELKENAVEYFNNEMENNEVVSDYHVNIEEVK